MKVWFCWNCDWVGPVRNPPVLSIPEDPEMEPEEIPLEVLTGNPERCPDDLCQYPFVGQRNK